MEEIYVYLNLPGLILSRHSGAKYTHKGQEVGQSHVGGTQFRKPMVWGADVWPWAIYLISLLRKLNKLFILIFVFTLFFSLLSLHLPHSSFLANGETMSLKKLRAYHSNKKGSGIRTNQGDWERTLFQRGIWNKTTNPVLNLFIWKNWKSLYFMTRSWQINS